MGIKMMVEIMDHWQDVGLTGGERTDLIVIAENANDGDRETRGSIHEGWFLRRVGKNAPAWRVALSALKKKGVLAYAVRNGLELSGRPGHWAVYRIPILCPQPPHSGYHGLCAKPERVSPQLTHHESPDHGMGYPSANPNERLGYPSANEWVSSHLTPPPHYPSGTTPSTTAPPAEHATDGGGGGGDRQDEQRQQAAAFLRSLHGRWAIGRATANKLAPLLLEAVREQGWLLDAELAAKLTEDLGPVRTYPGALAFRIGDLPKKPSNRKVAQVAEPDPLHTCSCGRMFRAPEPGPCRDCREKAEAGPSTETDEQKAAAVRERADAIRQAMRRKAS